MIDKLYIDFRCLGPPGFYSSNRKTKLDFDLEMFKVGNKFVFVSQFISVCFDLLFS